MPALAIEEVRSLRPDLSQVLDDLALHPSVIVRSLTDPEEPVAADVEWLLDRVGLYDVLAGHVVHVANRRGWEAMTTDPGRLRRTDPNLALTLI